MSIKLSDLMRADQNRPRINAPCGAVPVLLDGQFLRVRAAPGGPETEFIIEERMPGRGRYSLARAIDLDRAAAAAVLPVATIISRLLGEMQRELAEATGRAPHDPATCKIWLCQLCRRDDW